MFAFARRRLATAEQAEDAVSESMVRAMHRIGAFTWSSAGIDGWLFGIARNVVLEAYRSRARSTPFAPETLNAHPAVAGDPLDDVVTDEDAARMRAAFARLPDDDRQLLELRVVVGLDARQVGAVIGRRSGAVRTAQSRALQRLRTEYAGSR